MTDQGRFITLEGVEGVGKSTQAGLVAELLLSRGLRVIRTREPGGVPLAEDIRSLLLRTDGAAVHPMAELLLMFAARAAHWNDLIRPALQRGDWVVCDRFTDASVAYQGGGRGLPREFIAALARAVHGDRVPDLTLLLDAPPEAVRSRLQLREADRFEGESAAFFARVRATYLDLARASPERIRVIDASRPLATVSGEIAGIIAGLISKKSH